MHVIKYTESERGWGGEVWYREAASEQIARAKVKDVMERLPTSYVPDSYVIAEYVGEMDELPRGGKF